MDVNPKAFGHFLVIPKVFSRNLITIENEDLKNLIVKARKIACEVIKKLKVDGFQLIINNESSGHQEVFYTHIHIIPADSKSTMSLAYFAKKIKIQKFS